MKASTTEQQPKISLLGLGLVFMTPGLGGLLFGFDLGATSFVLSMLLRDVDPSVWWHSLQTAHINQGLIVSALSLGALVGSHIVLFHLAKTLGRRAELRITSVLYLVGTALNVTSGTLLRHSSMGIYALIVGRFIYGIGVGFLMHGVSRSLRREFAVSQSKSNKHNSFIKRLPFTWLKCVPLIFVEV